MLKRLALLSIIMTLLAVSCWGEESVSPGWRRFAFNGRDFQEIIQPKKISVLLKNGYLPDIVSPGQVSREDVLPEGTGGVAGICYIETGGKKKRGGYIPLAGAVIELSRGAWRMAARADAQGYFVLALLPGEYELKLFGFSGRFRVESGKNALVAVRGGKQATD
ncbi:hypothetical protein [Geobacter sp. AOG1]|uniref:hypothetical protein n=1 Tax=Geobacter sp. AOG1 TaxID=1566346 RepID=UPI001CC489D0|nr:hypothetical protein [Geobacter sp. AOG1]GFE59330.1 hypothetical protein AOG1_32100 [Geobacter sp. AOG1]